MTRKTSRTARIIRQRRKHRQRSQGSATRLGRWIGCGIGLIFGLMLLGTVTAIGSGIAIYAVYARQLPPADSIVSAQAESFHTTIFYDRTGTIPIHEMIDPQGGDRQYIAIDEVPTHFLQATIAIEDASFYDNPGFDIEGMMRAMWINVTSDQVQGGSTITQQLVKNQLLTEEERNAQTLDRKLKEIILATELSRKYSKDQILEWYINTNFYGNLAYGVEAAARVYFDKPARELTLAESALLAAIPQSPAKNPIDDAVAARERQRVVLQEMVRQGFITDQEMTSAFNQTIVVPPASQRFDSTVPHFAWYAQSEVETILRSIGYERPDIMFRRGLRIYTTLDLDLQRQIECVARTHVERLSGADPEFVHNTNIATPCVAAEFLPPLPEGIGGVPRNVTNAAGIMIRGNTGEVVAMLGSVNPGDASSGEFNVTTSEQRSPASTFKPFVYVTAFIHPIDGTTVVTPATMTYDIRREFNNGTPEPYIPENIDFVYHGPVSVREALVRSYNVPAVQVLNWVGIDRVLQTAHSMGINSMNEGLSSYGLSLALGSAGASLLDMTYAYNVFNNMGVMVGTPVPSNQARVGYRQLNPVAILRIETIDGEVLWAYGEEYGTFDRRAVLEPGMAYMITDILSDNDTRHSPSFPRGNALELSRPAAAKTGTSDDFRDSWTIGYTPQYTTGIWVGNNDNSSMVDVTGLLGAAPIWHAIMEYAHVKDALPVESWEQPPTIVEQDVCRLSGLLPHSACPTVSEIFYYDRDRNIDYRPNRVDPYWQTLSVNTCNNTLAVPYSDPQCVVEKDYFDYPDELRNWAVAAGVELPPTTYDTADSTPIFSPVTIYSPLFLETVNGLVEIRGNARDADLAYYRVEFGRGNTPTAWQQIGSSHEEGGGDILLETWDTTTVPDDLYTLRLTIVRNDSTVEIANQEVVVDNTPPTVQLSSPAPGQTYSAERDVFLEISAEPSDNRQIDYVEFYLDGDLLGRLDAAPYSYRWEITKSGLTFIWVVVTDEAGNQTQSDRMTIQLTP